MRALPLALLLMASLAPVAWGGSLSLVPASPSHDTVATGDVVTFEIHMDFTNEPTYGGNFGLLYDATSLGFVSFYRDESIGDPAFSADPDIYEGFLDNWAAASLDGIPEIAVLGSVTFVVLPTMQASTTLSLTRGGSLDCQWLVFPDATSCYDVDYGSITIHRVPLPAAGGLLICALVSLGACRRRTA